MRSRKIYKSAATMPIASLKLHSKKLSRPSQLISQLSYKALVRLRSNPSVTPVAISNILHAQGVVGLRIRLVETIAYASGKAVEEIARDDFLSENEEAILSMAIADRILLARSLLDSVSSTLLGTDIDPQDDEDYECIEEDE